MKMLAPFLLASAILLTACQPNVSPSQFSLPTQSTQSNTYSYQGVSVDTQKIPVKPTGELIQAKEITENMPGGSGIPTHYRINLGTEPLGERFNPIQPQILIYNTSQNTDTSTALKDLITQKPANPTYIPVAPLINATQVFRAHTKYLDFNNGSGVRFLTYYSQGINPITNSDLFYTYQGLTSDGKYRISVYYPISSIVILFGLILTKKNRLSASRPRSTTRKKRI